MNSLAAVAFGAASLAASADAGFPGFDASIRDGVTGGTSHASSSLPVPDPCTTALLAVAGCPSRGRRH